MTARTLPWPLSQAIARAGIPTSQLILWTSIHRQSMSLLEISTSATRVPWRPVYHISHTYRVSTSKFGVGQQQDSNQTPLGLHQISHRIGGGLPAGTVFKGRKPIGLTWNGLPNASIVHRILRLEGLEPGLNRGGTVDSFHRYIYIHGFSDESTLGKPQSHGCIHMAVNDLLPLFDRCPSGTLVWITRE